MTGTTGLQVRKKTAGRLFPSVSRRHLNSTTLTTSSRFCRRRPALEHNTLDLFLRRDSIIIIILVIDLVLIRTFDRTTCSVSQDGGFVFQRSSHEQSDAKCNMCNLLTI